MDTLKIAILVALIGLSVQPAAAESLKLVDAHIHYSHDARELYPVAQAIDMLRGAGLAKAFVSSSSDDGTLALLEAAPDLVVPVLRPYRRRGELGTWLQDDSVIPYLEKRLQSAVYAGIGEFHAYGDDVASEVMQAVIRLARQHKLFLHAHSDSEAVERIFATDPDARVLWAHSGFAAPEEVQRMLARYPNLWADLAFRSEHATGEKVDLEWRALFEAFPDRFLVGTDTYTPERWYYVREHADWTRGWLRDLAPELARNIAWRNADRLLESASRRP